MPLCVLVPELALLEEPRLLLELVTTIKEICEPLLIHPFLLLRAHNKVFKLNSVFSTCSFAGRDFGGDMEGDLGGMGEMQFDYEPMQGVEIEGETAEARAAREHAEGLAAREGALARLQVRFLSSSFCGQEAACSLRSILTIRHLDRALLPLLDLKEVVPSTKISVKPLLQLLASESRTLSIKFNKLNKELRSQRKQK